MEGSRSIAELEGQAETDADGQRIGSWLGVSQNTIRKLVADGKLPAYLIGEKKLVRFDPADLDRFLASRRVDNS